MSNTIVSSNGAAKPHAAGIAIVEMMTIGRSPRWDIVSDVAAALGDGVELLQSGALDQLSDDEVAALPPRSEDDALIASLGRDRTALVSKAAIGRLLQERIDHRAGKSDVFAVLCTGVFPALASERPVAQVGRLLLDAVTGHGRQACLGIVIPISEQTELNQDLWSGHAERVITAVASPYDGSDGVREAARDLVAEGATMIILSCMGYSSAIHVEISASVVCPVVAPVQVLIDHLSRSTVT